MYDTYVNAVLSEQAMEGNSLMTAYSGLNEELDEIGIEYESYLQNMGRQLFYTVASSYITLYLAIVFLVVANTIVGVQFLMSQQKAGRRYQTLDPPGSHLRKPLPVCRKADCVVYGTSCIGCSCQQSVWSQSVVYRDTLVSNPWDSV